MQLHKKARTLKSRTTSYNNHSPPMLVPVKQHCASGKVRATQLQRAAPSKEAATVAVARSATVSTRCMR